MVPVEFRTPFRKGGRFASDAKQVVEQREFENMHSILESLLPFQVLQRWDGAGKSGFIHGFLMGHNILARLALPGGF